MAARLNQCAGMSGRGSYLTLDLWITEEDDSGCARPETTVRVVVITTTVGQLDPRPISHCRDRERERERKRERDQNAGK